MYFIKKKKKHKKNHKKTKNRTFQTKGLVNVVSWGTKNFIIFVGLVSNFAVTSV